MYTPGKTTLALLEDIERRIDPSVEEDFQSQWRDFLYGKFDGEIFIPARKKGSPPSFELPKININDAVQDEDLMILSQLERCHQALSGRGNTLMIMRPNYGVGIIASMFGAEKFIMPYEMDTLPNVRALPGGEEAIKRLLDAPEPTLMEGYGEHVFSIGEKFAEIRQKYPKIGRLVRFDNPDGQGPIDNCELLWGSDMIYAFYDEPDLLHALLERVTDTLLRFVRKWQTVIPNEDGLTSYFGRLGRGNIVIRNDSAMNLSPELFEEFIRPYDSRLFKELNGGIVHFCGTGDHFVKLLAQTPGLSSVDMSQPHLNDMQKMLSALPDQGINLFVPKGSFSLEGHAVNRINAY